jgi:hypothetical protein
VPIGDYIKGVAKKRMKIEGGVKYEKITYKRETYHYGKQTLLARLLGFRHKKGRYAGKPHSNWIYTSWSRGCQPKDPEARRLLLRYAAWNGKALAMHDVRQKFPSIAHWYHY